jgi:hypothetical protein
MECQGLLVRFGEAEEDLPPVFYRLSGMYISSNLFAFPLASRPVIIVLWNH